MNQRTLLIVTALLLTLPVVPAELNSQTAIAQTVDRRAEADKLLESGIQQYRTGQVSAAQESLQQALEIFQSLKDAPKQIRALRSLGNVYYLRSQYAQAIAYYEQSLALARQTQNREGEAAALGNLGVVAAGRGNYRQAETFYQQALPLYRQVKDRQGEGQTLSNLAEVAYGNADYSKAIDLLNQAIALARSLKDPQLEANSLGTLGVVYYSLSDYPKSIAYSEQQLSLSRRLKDRRGEAAGLNNLGNAHYALGNYGQAIAFLEQRLVIARETQDRLGEAQSLKNLSSVYSDLGSNFTKALDYVQQVLAIALEIQNKPLEASAYSSLGNFYAELGNHAEAVTYHQKHLAMKRELGDLEGQGTALLNLGIAYKWLGRVNEATQTHEQAIAIARKLNNRTLESSALLNLGVQSDDAGQYDTAIGYHQKALALARATNDRSTEAIVLNNLGNSLFKAGKMAEAEATLRTGIRAWETLRALGRGTRLQDSDRVSLYSQQIRTYRLLQRALVAQNKPDAALEIAESGRARVFVELVAARLGEGSKALSSIAARPAPTINQIKAIAKSQNATLVQYSIIYEDEVVAGKTRPRESALYIWTIAPTGAVAFRTVDLKPLRQQNTSLEELVVASRSDIGVVGRHRRLARGAIGASREPAAQLYQLLIQPIAESLPTDPNARVVIVPDRALFLLPFAALKSPTGKYLIERHTLVTAPSIEVLGLTRQLRDQNRRAKNLSALVVGNPTMPKVPPEFGAPPEPLDPLPGAEQEAKAIAALLGTRAIVGAAATKPAIVAKLPQQRLIHLATHGLLDTVEGLPDDLKKLGIPGAIALAPSGTDSGLLTVDEILRLKLNAELVVLSACDTGRGRITGDGVIGLARSFVAAGVPSLVVSLWAIPDAPTASLMVEFYKSLKQDGDRAKALRQAMLMTMREYPNPRDWAAFTLIGEAN